MDARFTGAPLTSPRPDPRAPPAATSPPALAPPLSRPDVAFSAAQPTLRAMSSSSWRSANSYVPLQTRTALPVDSDEQARLQASVDAKLKRRLLPVLFVAALMCYLDRTNLSFAALDMNSDLGFSQRTYGVGAGVFFATYAGFGVPSSVFVKRIGAKLGLPLILFAWGVSSGAMALINSVHDFYLLRLLVGATESGFFPAVIYYLTLWMAEEDMGLSYTIVMTSTAVSGIIGGPLAGLLMTYLHGILGMAGWRWLFVAEAVPTILLSVFMFFYLDAEPASARFLTTEERQWLMNRQKMQLERRNGQHAVAGLMDALKLQWLWILIAIWLLYSCGYYGVIFWLPLLLKSVSQMSNVLVGFLSALPYLAAGAAMLLVARSSDRSGERRMHLAAAALISCIGFFSASAIHTLLGDHLALLLLCLSVAASGIWAMFGPYWGIPTAILSGETAAAGFALINSTGVIGGYCGPFIVGELTARTGSYDAALALFGVFMAISAALALCLQSGIGDKMVSPAVMPLNRSGETLLKYSFERRQDVESPTPSEEIR